MSLIALVMIVASAGLHASWNLLAKKNRMSVPFYLILCGTSTLLWCHVQFWTPVNLRCLPLRFWLFLLGSTASDLLYCFGLVQAYRRLEMATAYPMMRALPIIFTAVLTMLCGWGEPPSPAAMAGFAIVFAGAMLMPLNGFGDFSLRYYCNYSVFFILVVALGTTGYTVFDSRAMAVLGEICPQVSKPVRALTYYSTRGITLSTWLVLWTLLSAENRRCFREIIQGKLRSALPAGIFASATYVLVLLAMNYVTNVSYVQAFRQLGLPFGMLLGIIFLREKSAAPKWAGVSLILAGLAVTALC